MSRNEEARQPKPGGREGDVARNKVVAARVECERCGTEMYDSHCKIICPRCGYQRDCSDP